jgi:hypothetical protein
MTLLDLPSEIQFFEKAFLQPYLKWGCRSGTRPAGRELRLGDVPVPFAVEIPRSVSCKTEKLPQRAATAT